MGLRPLICIIDERRYAARRLLHTPEIGVHILFFFASRFVFRPPVFFLSRVPARANSAKICCDSRSRAYARIRRARSLWPSVTVYSFRSYFAPVVLKKSQSTRDKYARVPRTSCCNLYPPICRDSCRNADKYLPSLFPRNKRVCV